MATVIPKPLHRSAGLWALGFIAAFGLLLWAVPAPEKNAASEGQILARRTIDVCWQQQGRKSMSPEGKRFIAGACEQAEQDYLLKYGRYYTRDGEKQ